MGGRRLCLVEDDRDLAELLVDYLGRHGFEVDHVHDGLAAVELVQGQAPDLVLLDVVLPGIDGFEICRRIRPDFRGPILMMTARVEDIDEIVGLEVGADDYVKKPVDPRVLLARIRAALRRATPEPTSGGARRDFGELEIDAGRYEARVAGRDANLTTAEFELLWLLSGREGTPVTRDELHLELRGVPYDGVDRSIDLRVSRLRKKLGPVGAGRIRSLRGIGYLWAVDP